MKNSEKSESNEKGAESKKFKNCVVYLLITYSLEKGKTESDSAISFQEKGAKIIHSEKNEKENNDDYVNVIAYTVENPKKSKQKLEFKIGEKKDFAINFQYKAGICFIYQLELFSVDFFYNSQKKINQIMNFIQKFEVFLKSIKKLEQENLYNDLFKDTINIYSEYPKFDFMVNIFVNI